MAKTPEVAREIKRRIMVAVWALAYEVFNVSLVPDSVFDAEAKLIDPKIKTGREPEDTFFATEFSPHTGMWVRKHPDIKGLKRVLLIVLENRRGENT